VEKQQLLFEMTQEEKRIRIIEFCKWKDISDSCHHRKTTYQCVTEEGLMTVGDPFEDLNACHEAEKVLGSSLATYHTLLCDMHEGNEYKVGADVARQQRSRAISATAAQRAEALGKILGLWK
jgi:hypothetical protein